MTVRPAAWSVVAGLLLWGAACHKETVISAFPESYVGIGVELTIATDGLPEVVKVLPGGSAAEAAIAAGDKFLSIDGQAAAGKTLADVVTLLRGQPGTQVAIEVQRQAGRRERIVVKRHQLQKSGDGYVGGKK
jgi:carboxyl-terminal processing protease